jgi:hypothetical protein
LVNVYGRDRVNVKKGARNKEEYFTIPGRTCSWIYLEYKWWLCRKVEILH